MSEDKRIGPNHINLEISKSARLPFQVSFPQSSLAPEAPQGYRRR